MNSGDVQRRVLPAPDLSGWYHREAQQQEEQMVVLGHYLQFQPIVFSVGVASPGAGGIYPADGGFLNISGNGLHLVTGLGKPGTNGVLGDLLISSVVARLLVQINNEKNPWIPMSLVPNQADFQYIGATIARVRFRVAVIDGAGGAIVCFMVVNNAGVSSVTGAASSAGSYSVPAGQISTAQQSGSPGSSGASGGAARSMIRSGGGGQF